MEMTEPGSSGSQEIRLRKEAARAFSAVGVVAIGLGLVVLVFGSLPVRLMDPACSCSCPAPSRRRGSRC